jgi:hypothetical protein
MEAGKNSVIYMGLISGPNKADDTCGRTTVTGTMDRGFTVHVMTTATSKTSIQHRLLSIQEKLYITNKVVGSQNVIPPPQKFLKYLAFKCQPEIQNTALCV